MIVRQFLQWIQTAPATARADATAALARAYLHSDLGPDDRAVAESAMIMLLDDPSPLVRAAMAEAVGSSAQAPRALIDALAADREDIASCVLARSPLFSDADLVDRVGAGNAAVQAAIASRACIAPAVAAAVAEVGSAESCLILIENEGAAIALFSLERIVARHAHLAAIRDSLLARDDVPAALRQALVAKLSDTLAEYVARQQWLKAGHARRVAREACEKATVALAAAAPQRDNRALARHLLDSDQLTPALLLRALLSGNLPLFAAALSELTELPAARVGDLLTDGSGRALRAAFDRARLPRSLVSAAQAALEIMREAPAFEDASTALRLKRRLVDAALARCQRETREGAEGEPLLALLRRFALEAARDEARSFCADLVAA